MLFIKCILEKNQVGNYWQATSKLVLFSGPSASKQQANNKQTTSKKILDNEMKFTKTKKYFVHTYDSLRPLTYSDKLAAQFLAIFFFLQTNSISRENEEFEGA